MTGRPAALAAIAVALVAARAEGCPCQGSAGPGGSVTTPSERFGASVTETARAVNGAWGPRGEFASLAPGSRIASLDLTAIAGYRPVSEIEASAEAAFGHESAALPYVTSTRTGFGDLTIRVRWDAVDEPMPFTASPLRWPALSLVWSVRAPTAARGTTTFVGSTSSSAAPNGAFSGTTGSVGASASSEGLGAWEGSFAAVLLERLGTEVQVSALGEAAYRLPDSWTGVDRHLAPRFFTQVGARYSPSEVVSVGALTDFGWEGNVELDGDAVPESNQRLWTVSAYFLLKPPGTGLRWGFLARTAPPVSDIGVNALATTSVGVSMGYAK